MFIIIYSRIIDRKKDGLSINGPFFGPECETMADAHNEAKKITSSSNDHILIRIYDLNKISYNDALKFATSQFNAIFEQMQTINKLSRSTYRKFKKRKTNKY